MRLLSPDVWPDYELIDSGNFEKLERFGPYILIRPEPQAIWDKKLHERDWQKMAHVQFIAKSSSSGVWKKFKEMPERWTVQYKSPLINISFRLGLTAFKHVGVFPEQSVNWDYIAQAVKQLNMPSPKVLNLFAYTGGASLAAKCAGADVTHVDSVKQVVSWAKENMELSRLDAIRWMVEDALTYVKREVKRGKKYHGIILDPPAYGHGANGESWKLERDLNEMLKHVISLLDEEKHFFLLNTYSLGFSALILENLIKQNISKNQSYDIGELFIKSKSQSNLPLGVFARFEKLAEK